MFEEESNTESTRKLATIQRISELIPIEGADRIELAKMEGLGWQCVVKTVREKWADLTILTPPDYIGPITQILYDHEADTGHTETLPDGKVELHAEMPLRELMRGFFDRLKSASSGFASLSYEIMGFREANVVRMDVLSQAFFRGQLQILSWIGDVFCHGSLRHLIV
jgi:translation elongation factor EF-4